MGAAREGYFGEKVEDRRQHRGERTARQGGVGEEEEEEEDCEGRDGVEEDGAVVVVVVDAAGVGAVGDAGAVFDPGSRLHTEDIDATGRKGPAGEAEDGVEEVAEVAVAVAVVGGVHAIRQTEASGAGPLEVQGHHKDRAVWTCRRWSCP